MKRTTLNPVGELARWLRQNQNHPEAVELLKLYEKKYKFSDEEYKQGSKLRERLEVNLGGYQATLKPGIYYKPSTQIIYKVAKISQNVEWREVSRTWWSNTGDKVKLAQDIANMTAIRLTPKLASEIGIETGVCCSCGKTLTTKKSMERGIGPECYKVLQRNISDDQE